MPPRIGDARPPSAPPSAASRGRGSAASLFEPQASLRSRPHGAGGGRGARLHRAGEAGHVSLDPFLSCNKKGSRPPGRVPARVRQQHKQIEWVQNAWAPSQSPSPPALSQFLGERRIRATALRASIGAGSSPTKSTTPTNTSAAASSTAAPTPPSPCSDIPPVPGCRCSGRGRGRGRRVRCRRSDAGWCSRSAG